MKTPGMLILVRLLPVLMAATWLGSSGCDSVSLPSTSAPSSAPTDPFTAAIVEAESGEKRYIEAVKPALEAIAKRDWAAFYNALSTHAKAKMNTFQFDQIPKQGTTEPENKVITSPDERMYGE